MTRAEKIAAAYAEYKKVQQSAEAEYKKVRCDTVDDPS